MSDSNFRYNQKESHKDIQYRSLANYPYPEPKNIYSLNPLVLKSLKNLDVDDLQDVFGKISKSNVPTKMGKNFKEKLLLMTVMKSRN